MRHKALTSSSIFEVVILNSVFIGFEVEFSIQTPPVRSEFMQAA